MRTAAMFAGAAMMISGGVAMLAAMFVALASTCTADGPCAPGADGTPLFIAGVILAVVGAALNGWGND